MEAPPPPMVNASAQHPQESMRRRMNERGEYIPVYPNPSVRTQNQGREMPMPGMPSLQTNGGGEQPPHNGGGQHPPHNGGGVPPPPHGNMNAPSHGGVHPPSSNGPHDPNNQSNGGGGHGPPPPTWNNVPQGPSTQTHGNMGTNGMPNATPSGKIIWGCPETKVFQSNLDTAVCHFMGQNWIDFKYDFQLLMESCGLWGFVLMPPLGHTMPNDPILIHEFRRYTTTVFHGLHQRC